MDELPAHSLHAIGGSVDVNGTAARRALELGLLCQFALTIARHAGLGLQAWLDPIIKAQKLGQLKVYVNGYDECVGYVSWAFLSPEVEAEFLAGRPRPLAHWEYNEGTSAWLIDFAVAPASLPYVFDDLRDRVFAAHPAVHYFRGEGETRVVERACRREGTGFMAGAALPLRVADAIR